MYGRRVRDDKLDISQACQGHRIIRAVDIPVDQYLYHYTGADTAGLILDSGSLRLGPYANTNDPREAKVWHAGIGGIMGGPWEGNFGRYVQQIDQQLRGRVKLACFTRDKPWDSARGYHYFHRGWARARMWQQYADAHRGVCLIFDRAELHAMIEHHIADRGVMYEGAVVYEDEGLQLNFSGSELDREGVEATVRRYLTRNWQELFLRKNTDWASEVEYRYLALTEQPVEFVPIRSALVGIVLGEDFPAREAARLPRRLRGAAVSKDLRVASCRWWQGEPLAVTPNGWEPAKVL